MICNKVLNMLTELFQSSFYQKKFFSSWIIESNNILETLKNIEEFIKYYFFKGDVDLKNHPDYYFIAKEASNTVNTKNILVEQIRKLQEFLSKTSIISGYKIAIIYEADLMNVNAANSCLKILEEPSKNSYIFLITTRAASLLPTITSRCFRINLRDTYPFKVESYLKFISPIADHKNLNSYLTFIDQFSSKNKGLWLDFIDSILYLINRITKKALGINIDLMPLENQIFNNISVKSHSQLLDKFTNIKGLIHDTIDYDLELKTSCVLVIDQLTH